METSYSEQTQKKIEKRSVSREEQVAKVVQFEQVKAERDLSERQFARENGIQRTTFRGWKKYKSRRDVSPQLAAFFESPEGLKLLHRIICAAIFVITQLCKGGYRQVSTFLELSGLNAFAASSHGVQYQVMQNMENIIVEYGVGEAKRLGEEMKPKEITVIEDETFHPEKCLVAIEPISTYILVEKYVDELSHKTWDDTVEEATDGLQVDIIQSTSDEGSSVKKHATEGLGCHHSPDIFHGQREILKSTSFQLSNKERKAEKRYEEAERKRERALKEQERVFGIRDAKPREMIPVAKKYWEAEGEERRAKSELESLKGQRERICEEVRGISKDYHPYDLETGAPRSAEEVVNDLTEHFKVINNIAEQTHLSEKSKKGIAKAQKLVVQMGATIAFYHLMVLRNIESLNLPEKVEDVIFSRWLPGRYLELVANRFRDAASRCKQRTFAQNLMLSQEERDALLSFLDADMRLTVALVIDECAQLFQRASSSVEGRNSHLRLFHHGFHRLSTRKLKSLTTVHNFFMLGPDGTTPAERFFGQKPRDLFEYILLRMEKPKRPAKPRNPAIHRVVSI